MLRPPQHRADALGRYVHALDDAWDRERLDAEAARGDGHPFVRYVAGKTRFDLSAEGVRDYLRPGATPMVFVLRRLTLAEYVAVRDVSGMHAMWTACARLGLVGVEDGGEQRKVTVDELFAIHPDLPWEVGMAVWLYNRPIDEVEGKPSGSAGTASSPTEPGKPDGSR